MTISGLSRYALCSCAAAAMLAGCGALRQAQDDTQPPVGPPGAMPQTSAIRARADRGKSWMLPEAKGADLLYASAGNDVYVFSYPAGKLVGTLKGFHDSQDMCPDKNGNVWIANDPGGSDGAAGQLLKYAHGGTKPIVTLSDAASPIDCAVDPTTGNLAVVNFDLEPFDEGLAVYAAAKGKPHYFKLKVGPGTCTYDDHGNVFVTGRVSNYQAGIEWLQKGASHVEKFPLHPFVYPHYGALWDGKHLAVANRYLSLYQYAVQNKVGEQIREVTLDPGLTSFWIEGSTLVAAYREGSVNDIYIYSYPKGGTPMRTIVPPTDVFGVTVSVAN
jgi:hypothetical protein